MPQSELRVAALQLNSQAIVDENLSACEALAARAAASGARLVLLPENFAFFGPEDQKPSVAEKLGDPAAPIQSALRRIALQNRITVIAGGFPELAPDPARPFNTCSVFGPSGELLSAYRKIHLFDVDIADGMSYRESWACSAGADPVVVEIEGFKVGLSICYDLRFPELYRALVARGAEVLVVPAAFTRETGKDHWHVLLRARAIEAQAWVVAAAQWGRHSQTKFTYGHSLIVDPWGIVVSEASERVGFISGSIDRAYQEDIRSKLPSLRHRKL